MKANDRAVVNDSPVDCQSREVTEDKFSTENLSRPGGSNPLSATNIALTGAKPSFSVIFAVNEGCFVSNMVVIWYVFAIDIIAIVK